MRRPLCIFDLQQWNVYLKYQEPKVIRHDKKEPVSLAKVTCVGTKEGF